MLVTFLRSVNHVTLFNNNVTYLHFGFFIFAWQ
jgi:hypothetical protein